jgi:acetolactate synthase-1/2/3 large subunit
VEKTEEFAPALARAQAEKGVKLLHLKTDVEYISAGTTITKLRERTAG